MAKEKYEICNYTGRSNFENRLKKLLSYLESNDNWDIFLGGVKKCNDKINFYPLRNKLENILINNSHKYIIIYVYLEFISKKYFRKSIIR